MKLLITTPTTAHYSIQTIFIWNKKHIPVRQMIIKRAKWLFILTELHRHIILTEVDVYVMHVASVKQSISSAYSLTCSYNTHTLPLATFPFDLLKFTIVVTWGFIHLYIFNKWRKEFSERVHISLFTNFVTNSCGAVHILAYLWIFSTSKSLNPTNQFWILHFNRHYKWKQSL